MNDATRRFVQQNALCDVRQTALRGTRDADVDMAAALQQIQGLQTARRKLPLWAAAADILYPPHLSMEQCSSQAAASYKAEVVRRLLPTADDRRLLADLTGGFGVDFTLLCCLFREALYVEQQPELFAIVEHNLGVLRRTIADMPQKLRTRCGDAAGVLHDMEHATLTYVDPARRDTVGQRTYGIGDCTPNVLLLEDELLAKSDHVMLKLSPMLDWRKAVSDLGAQHLEQVHIVAVGGECKELLIVLSATGAEHPQLFCVNDNSAEVFDIKSSTSPASFLIPHSSSLISPSTFLYEPNAALMKSGMFRELAERYGVAPLSANSHLFTSEHPVATFPGRAFTVTAVSSMNRGELRSKVAPLRQANISVRNFPLSADALRQRLHLRDGGPSYIFATTLSDGTHVLLVCRKADF